MRIGKQDAPYSAICTSDAESITVRGRDLVREIIGKMDFTSYFWFLVTGEEPNEDQAFFANAILCALAEHGLVPSVVAARMTYAAAPCSASGAAAYVIRAATTLGTRPCSASAQRIALAKNAWSSLGCSPVTRNQK